MTIINYPAVTLTSALVAALPGSGIIDYLAFANTSAVETTVTVQDGNGKNLVPATVIEPNSFSSIPLPPGGLWFFNGVKWMAGNAGVVDAWIRELR